MESAVTAESTIGIIELGHNRSELAGKSADRSISMSRYQQLLQDSGKVDCPLLARVGYPIILVSTTAGQKCIPQAQVVPIGSSTQNNRMATVAASRIGSGLALGCVVGNLYVLRTDGKDLTSKEWLILFDYLLRLMHDYGYPGRVGDTLLSQYKADVRMQMTQQGLLRSGPTGSGVHCWCCGVEGSDESSLRKCAACKNARYCSKECQVQDWRAGHKQTCSPRQTPQQAQSEKERLLLESAVLKPEQVIARDAPAPPLPAVRNRTPYYHQLSAQVDPYNLALLCFNKTPNNKERLCAICKTHYRLLDPAPDDQCSREQKLSGICSYRCWCAANPPGTQYATPEWYGQAAMNPSEHGVTEVHVVQKRR